MTVVVTSVTSIVSPYILSREIIAKYILRSDFAVLQQIVLVFVGILIVNWIANALRTYGLGKIGENMLFRTRSELFSHLPELSFSYFDGSDNGEVISRITSDTDSISEAFTSGLVQVLSDILSIVMIVAVMFSINIQLSLATLLVVPLIFIFVAARAFNARFRAVYRAQRTKIAGVTSKLQEGISGIREINSLTREKAA